MARSVREEKALPDSDCLLISLQAFAAASEDAPGSQTLEMNVWEHHVMFVRKDIYPPKVARVKLQQAL